MSTGKFYKIAKNDNVAIALMPASKGECHEIDGDTVILEENIDGGHKVALRDIAKGENIIKYGFPIGHATQDIKKGQWVHVHNLKTNLEGILDYTYNPKLAQLPHKAAGTFQGYVRENGEVGIRNEIWVVNTVGCVNKTAEIIVREANAVYKDKCDGIYCFPHPYGCSQLGDDQLNTQKILAGLVKHPNAGGVLVLGLGCENNNIPEFKKVLGEVNPDRVKFLVAQESEDEIEEGVKLIGQLLEHARKYKRETVDISKLKIGLKCGGSDGYSGITANPLVGAVSDLLIAGGGTSILTEVPEMFGAETILMNRCINEEIFNKTVRLINDFKDYFTRHNQVIYENPSPGNKKGGITTLEEKSLGCTQKGGQACVVEVLSYGERNTKNGLNLLSAPGNDMVATTALVAAGAHMVLFTTGRGTPLGGPVPTVKISSNSDLARRKPQWIDFNAGVLLEGKSMEEAAGELFELILKIASGEIKTKSEINGYKEIVIFKDGVTL